MRALAHMRCILTAQLSMPMDGSVVYVLFSILSSLFSDLPSFWPSPKIRRVRWLHTNDPRTWHASVQNTKMCTTTSLSTPFCARRATSCGGRAKNMLGRVHRKCTENRTQGARTTKHLFRYVHLGGITRIAKPVLGALLVNNHHKREKTTTTTVDGELVLRRCAVYCYAVVARALVPPLYSCDRIKE